VDLTREQFRPDELVVGGQVVHRPDGPPKRRREEYDLFRDRVLARLRRFTTSVPPSGHGDQVDAQKACHRADFGQAVAGAECPVVADAAG
jgi:hypothetical protein